MSKFVNIRISEKERIRWQELAEEKNQNLSDYIRTFMNSEEVGTRRPVRRVKSGAKVPPAPPELIRAVAQLGNNLNQIARVANTNKKIESQTLCQLAIIEEQLAVLLAQYTSEEK